MAHLEERIVNHANREMHEKICINDAKIPS